MLFWIPGFGINKEKDKKMTNDTKDKPKKRSFIVDLLIRLVKEKPLGTIGGIIVIILFFVGIFANFLAPYPMNDVHMLDMLAPPSAKYLLGTDQLGRDILSNLIYGARISMIVGVCATVISTFESIVIGATTGLIGGKLDISVQRFVDAWQSFPGILITLTIMSIVGQGLFQIITVIGLTGGIAGSRVIRGATIAIKQNMYVDAAKADGCSTINLLTRHIIPNIMAPIIVIFTLSLGAAIMIEASMSFLGFGVPPGVPSWGSMLSWEGRKYMESAPQLAIWPGLCLSLAIYGINMFGDALRDLLDPRLKGGLGRYSVAKKKLRIRII
jgi:peptide/nickel transport system permease protein